MSNLFEQPGHGPPQVWESLVTPGHVNAARLRRLQPWLLAIGLVLILLGQRMLTEVRPEVAVNNREIVLDKEMRKVRRTAEEAFLLIPSPAVRRSQLARLVPADSLAETHKLILQELNRTGELPKRVKYSKVSASEFWRTEWPADRIIIAQNSKLKLVGAIFNAGTAEFPVPARWLSVYSRRPGGWENVAIYGGDFVGLQDQPIVNAGDIPVTLKPLLKTREKAKP